MDAKKEAFAAVLKKKSHDLDEAIRLVAGFIQNVKDDVEKIKDEIHAAFNSQMNLLHHREEQLLRQLDVLSSDEINFFHTRSAELHHLLGNLESYLRSWEEPIDYSFLDRINKKIERVNCFKKKQNLRLQFQFLTDAADLQRAIQNFGHVGMSGALVRSHFEGSLLLPSKMEYEDEDHQYFYKTLNEINAENNFVNEKLKFPNLQLEQNEWLASPNKSSLPSANRTFLADSLLKIDNGNNMSSVQNWLREMTSIDECELRCHSEMNSHRCSWNENSSQSSVDDSVVLLSMPRSNSLVDCVDVSLVNNGWLSNSSRENERKNCCGLSCSQNGLQWNEATSPKNFVDKNVWLRKTNVNASGEKSCLSLDVKEPLCVTDVCKNLCQMIRNENNAQPSNRNLNVENGSHILSSNKQKTLCPIQPSLITLFSKGNGIVSDVRKNADDGEVEIRKSNEIKKSFEFPQLHLNSEIKNWLHPDHQNFPSAEKETKNYTADNLMLINHSKWLADTATNEKVNNIKQNVAAMFHSYFDPMDLEIWLVKSNEKQL